MVIPGTAVGTTEDDAGNNLDAGDTAAGRATLGAELQMGGSMLGSPTGAFGGLLLLGDRH
jgi:hypothetical protein